MQINGFILLLQDFCEYCPDFEPDVEKFDCTSFGEAEKCCTNIRCENRSKCSRIAANIENRLAEVKENGD